MCKRIEKVKSRTPAVPTGYPGRKVQTMGGLTEGHRVFWLRSSGKQERDAKLRQQAIHAGIHALDALNQKLASPRTRIKTPEAAFDAATAASKATRASRYLSVTTVTNTLETIRQEKRGRPGKHTRYRTITRDTFIIRWRLNDDLAEGETED